LALVYRVELGVMLLKRFPKLARFKLNGRNEYQSSPTSVR
jgi:hypothetical protein